MDILTALIAELGPEVVTAEVPAAFRQDCSGLPPAQPLALVRPRSTAEVAAALRLCQAAGVPVVTQGGLTGISGGAHPLAGAIALSTARLDRIEAVDATMGTLTAGAGVLLERAQAAAEAADLFLGIDIGSRGSCTLGGVLSTNAGGNTVVRYGMARDHVLGLEVVLADGTVVPAMNGLIKNNAGLDLKQLFIGAEGTLGVITRAVLRLQPRPTARATALCGLPDTGAALALLRLARARLGPALSAFEVMWDRFVAVMAAGTGLRQPLARAHPVQVIVEATGFSDAATRDALEMLLAAALEAGLVTDAVLARSGREERDLWAIRESTSQFGRVLGPIIPFDVGLPLDRMAEVVPQMEAEIIRRWPDAVPLTYGHIGDSNLHLVVNIPSAGPAQPEAEVKALVYALVRQAGGTISAEHGLGAIKGDYLGYSRTAEEIALMRRMKAMLDPANILNPGRAYMTGFEAGV